MYFAFKGDEVISVGTKLEGNSVSNDELIINLDNMNYVRKVDDSYAIVRVSHIDIEINLEGYDRFSEFLKSQS